MNRKRLMAAGGLVVVVCLVTGQATELLCASEVSPCLVRAIELAESGGNAHAIGDRHLKKMAYGPLQIRQPVCDDVNRRYGTRYRAEDMRGNRALSEKVFRLYLGLHATKKNLGRAPTNEDRARIWNGGPKGWQKKSTRVYWTKKVRPAIQPVAAGKSPKKKG